MERLTRVRDGWEEYERAFLRILELEAIAERTTPVLSDLPKGQGSNSKDDVWAQLIDYKMRCERILEKYIRDCEDLEDELTGIRSPRIRTAMSYRYLDCKSIDYISEHMHLERRTVFRLLKTGRKIYEGIIKEKES